jgi:hypothetical protein
MDMNHHMNFAGNLTLSSKPRTSIELKEKLTSLRSKYDTTYSVYKNKSEREETETSNYIGCPNAQVTIAYCIVT